jgi:AhpD family alkylhydroperoxidase
MDERTKMLIAIGACVGANCHPCLEYHVGKATESGLSHTEIAAAIETAKAVRRGAAASMDKLATNLLNDGSPRQACESRESSCCCS